MLPARALRVRAAGISDFVTNPLRIGMIGVLIIVVPAPNAKVKINNMVGVTNFNTVVIRDTNKGFGTSDVINQDAPTSYIAAPTYEKRAAIHNVLYRANLKGLKPDELLFSSGGCTSL